MFNLFNADKKLKIFEKKIAEINFLENKVSHLTESEIKARINNLILIYQNTKNFDSILVESFALTREASKRTLGLRHFDVQLLGGMILHEGKIAEMKTGEGKTLVATLPIVLNALSLQGVHLVTVNDYLAERDKQTMSQLYRYLGLSVGLIQEYMDSDERRQNYSADITYVTNSQLAFDYLHDNMLRNPYNFVLREFNYCIIDEVDSILIDEARTPLILSGTLEIPIEKYVIADELCKYLQFGVHFLIDEKEKNITLTNKGMIQIERILGVETLYDRNNPWISYILGSLKAKNLFFKNVHYIVKNNEIVIVDDFTGRVMADRRWGDGLHQAIEAKENILIKNGSETLGSITYQNFFLSYPKFAGMTGTAKTAEAEFESIYKHSVISVPPAKKMIRKDLPDYIFKDSYSRWKAVARYVQAINKTGQPILIGTTNIEKSEIISSLLCDINIKHFLLNAKPENVKRESEIIAQAGRKYAVTVSTNMSGRGTDILLGGNPNFETHQKILLYVENLKFSSFNFLSCKNLCFYSNSHNLKKKIMKIVLRHFELELIYKEFFMNQIISLEKIITHSEFLNTKNIFNFLNENDLKFLLINLKENAYLNKNSIIQIYINSVYNYFLNKNLFRCNQEKKKIKIIGGLYVLGTERHESARIDNQLRGRAGRQGDPGTSKFFVSLDDDLFRIFGQNELKKRISFFYLADAEPLESKFLTNTLDKCQKKVESLYYDSRKYLFDYDEVINFQRRCIYRERKDLLKKFNIRSEIMIYGEELISRLAYELKMTSIKSDIFNFHSLNTEISYLLGINYLLTSYEECNFLPLSDITILLLQNFWLRYDLKEAEIEITGTYLLRLIEKFYVLNMIDFAWKIHLKKIDLLRETIGWRAYAQLEPLQEYKKDGFNLFIETIRQIKYNSVYDILKVQSI